VTLLDAMRDRPLFGRWFEAESWRAWFAFVAALFALPMSEAEAAIYAACTGRTIPPPAPAREAWLVVGRRGGKSRIAALIAVYLTAFRDHRAHLAPGEIATVPVIAADRAQARTVMRYVRGFVESTPMLAEMVTTSTAEAIEFSNRSRIEVHTASFRSTRGYTLAGAILDEVAFWRSDETSAEPDREIIAGLRPGLATLPGALLLAISSPYARRGELWNAHSRHFGQDGDPVLVWQAPTRAMNDRIAADVIAAAYVEDEASAAAEYGAEFRRDVEAFVSREIVEACVVPGRYELPPMRAPRYFGFVDPSGGSQDAMTLAVAHQEGARVVIDAVRERRPPFSPDDVVGEFAATLRTYHCHTVTGDRYAGEWPRERFRAHGIDYRVADRAKSDLYRDLLPLLTSARLELLDVSRLTAQLLGLERRTARGGRDSIDHAPRSHDDVINAVAGVCAEGARADHTRLIEREIW